MFKEVYVGTYPYKTLEDAQDIRNKILNSNFEFIVYKIGFNKIIGCLAVDIDLLNKKGFLHGFIFRKEYQKIVDTLKACICSLTYVWNKYKEKILIWYAEVRTNETTPQFFGSMCGLKPIAFYPKKDVFFNQTESDILIINYEDNVLKNYRTKEKPRIIRQVLNCYAYSNKRYNLGLPSIENPNIVLDPIILNEIERKIHIRKKKDKLNYKIITFLIEDSGSYFSFHYNPYSNNIEQTKYKIDKLEELYIFIQILKKFIKKAAIQYSECFVSSYEPSHQKIFFNGGFKPMGYIPSWRFNKKKNYFEDQIIFCYYIGIIDNNMKLIPESLELLQNLNMDKDESFPELSENLQI